MTQLQHDISVVLASALLETVQNRLRPEERDEAFDEFYIASKAALESYDIMKFKRGNQFAPSSN